MIAKMPTPTPDPGLIATLEDLLAKAQRGDLVAMVVATEHTGRSVGTAYCGDIDLYRMLGAIESVKRRLMEERDA